VLWGCLSPSFPSDRGDPDPQQLPLLSHCFRIRSPPTTSGSPHSVAPTPAPARRPPLFQPPAIHPFFLPSSPLSFSIPSLPVACDLWPVFRPVAPACVVCACHSSLSLSVGPLNRTLSKIARRGCLIPFHARIGAQCSPPTLTLFPPIAHRGLSSRPKMLRPFRRPSPNTKLTPEMFLARMQPQS